jgi:hypothetical protein
MFVYPAQDDELIGNVKGFEIPFTGTGSIKKFSVEEEGVRSEC